MAAIKKRSLVDQVYERLRSDIITLRLPLGSKVNVNELQDTLGVSCTPIREAVNRLQQEGLVTYENNVGAKVLTLAPRDVEEIQQLATTLHCAAAKLSMERGDRKVMTEQLRRRLGEFRSAETPAALTSAVHHFVEVFYVHCGNRRIFTGVGGRCHIPSLRRIWCHQQNGFRGRCRASCVDLLHAQQIGFYL